MQSSSGKSVDGKFIIAPGIIIPAVCAIGMLVGSISMIINLQKIYPNFKNFFKESGQDFAAFQASLFVVCVALFVFFIYYLVQKIQEDIKAANEEPIKQRIDIVIGQRDDYSKRYRDALDAHKNTVGKHLILHIDHLILKLTTKIKEDKVMLGDQENKKMQ